LVDDDIDITTFFKIAIEEAGFDVDIYNDPFKALLNFMPSKYDLLLIDIRMPRLNGFELIKKIRKEDEKVKVCFITSFETYYKSIIEEHPSLKRDLNCFIKKPIETTDLINRINRVLKVKNKLDFAGIWTMPLLFTLLIYETIVSVIN